MHENHLQGMLKLRNPTWNFDLVSLQWHLRTCISNKFSDDADAASLGPQFENHFKFVGTGRGQFSLTASPIPLV